ncbi:hypothetical protein [Bradyrhizobium sp. BR 1433]|uniref:hypothetical protein n=1 Tax=Bradyrhizobium sp. BR 1433 TaxID=3447967 RepID=UPI003EE6B4A6
MSWEKFEAIRTMVSSNLPSVGITARPSIVNALLAALIRCKRCGRKLALRYSGMEDISRATAAAAHGWTIAGPKQGPVFGSDLMTGEERVFSGQADRPDRVFNRIGVERQDARHRGSASAPAND